MTSRRRSALVALVVLAGAADAQPPSATLAGRVVLAEDVPRSIRRIINRTDPAICGPLRDVRDLSVSADGGIEGALVWIEGITGPASGGPPPAAALDNRDCRFEPQAQVARSGAVFELRNGDTTLHTVHWRGPSEENIALPLAGVAVLRHLALPGVYRVRCDVHPWMRAWIRVDDHPFHAATAADGSFRIDGLPPGRHAVVVWHERAGSLREVLDLGSAGVRERTFVLSGAP